MQAGKKIYFLSDFHLGIPDYESSLVREKKIVFLLDTMRKDAQEIFLMGDLFDFWFEYKKVVPRGFVRLLGKIAELTDVGIAVTIFTGNHDMWMFDYLPKETGVTLCKTDQIREFSGKKFYLGHGDGIGPGDHGYKFIKRVFANRFCQWLFARFHPNFGIWLADFWSKQSRKSTGINEAHFLGEDKEWQIIHSKAVLASQHCDYFIFGHRHVPMAIPIAEKSYFFNLGDWVSHFTYAEFDGSVLTLRKLGEAQAIFSTSSASLAE